MNLHQIKKSALTNFAIVVKISLAVEWLQMMLFWTSTRIYIPKSHGQIRCLIPHVTLDNPIENPSEWTHPGRKFHHLGPIVFILFDFDYIPKVWSLGTKKNIRKIKFLKAVWREKKTFTDAWDERLLWANEVNNSRLGQKCMEEGLYSLWHWNLNYLEGREVLIFEVKTILKVLKQITSYII